MNRSIEHYDEMPTVCYSRDSCDEQERRPSERRSFCFGLEGFDAGKLHAVNFGGEFRALRNQLFDESVMHDIALGRLQEALLLPYVIRHMITAHAQVDVLLGNPELWQHCKWFIFIGRRKYEHECRDIRRR